MPNNRNYLFNCQNELIRLYKDTFTYNMVKVPREGIEPFQLLIKEQEGFSLYKNIQAQEIGSSINKVLKCNRPFPEITDSSLPKQLQTANNKGINLNFSIIPDLILQLIGFSNTNLKVKLSTLFQNQNNLQFVFGEKAGKYSFDFNNFSYWLEKAKYRKTTAKTAKKYLEDNKVYIITKVFKTSQFAIENITNIDSNLGISVDDICNTISANTSFNVNTSAEKKLSFESDKLLTFAFRATRLICEKDEKGENSFSIDWKDNAELVLSGTEDEDILTEEEKKHYLQTPDNFIDI